MPQNLARLREDTKLEVPFASLVGCAPNSSLRGRASLELSSIPTVLLGLGIEQGRSVEREIAREGKDGAVVSMVRLVAKGTRLQEPWV